MTATVKTQKTVEVIVRVSEEEVDAIQERTGESPEEFLREVVDRVRKGMPWDEQSLRTATVLDVLHEARLAFTEGKGVINWSHWDHRSSYYDPRRSNKQAKMAGAVLLGRKCTWEEAKAAIVEAVVGRVCSGA